MSKTYERIKSVAVHCGSRPHLIGAIVGDIAGSRFEWRNCKSKDFTLLVEQHEGAKPCCFTDDTVMTLAIRNAISIGGDSDTIGAICGAVAGAYYGGPQDICAKAHAFLVPDFIETLDAFERCMGETMS